jgi:hypothetical protein
MTKQDPQSKPAKSKDELDEAQLSAITGGTDETPKPQPQPQPNLLKKFSDTQSGIIANIK